MLSCFLVTSVTLLPCYLCYFYFNCYLCYFCSNCYLVTSGTLLPQVPCYLCSRCYLLLSFTYLSSVTSYLICFLCNLCYLCMVADNCHSSKGHKLVNFRLNCNYFVLKIKRKKHVKLFCFSLNWK